MSTIFAIWISILVAVYQKKKAFSLRAGSSVSGGGVEAVHIFEYSLPGVVC